jgi:hypothetical protein
MLYYTWVLQSLRHAGQEASFKISVRPSFRSITRLSTEEVILPVFGFVLIIRHQVSDYLNSERVRYEGSLVPCGCYVLKLCFSGVCWLRPAVTFYITAVYLSRPELFRVRVLVASRGHFDEITVV